MLKVEEQNKPSRVVEAEEMGGRMGSLEESAEVINSDLNKLFDMHEQNGSILEIFRDEVLDMLAELVYYAEIGCRVKELKGLLDE